MSHCLQRLGAACGVCLVIALAGTPACVSNADVCSRLNDAITKCDLPNVQIDCGTAEESVKEALLQRIEAQGCDGTAQDGTDAVDPRLCALAGWSCPAPPTPAPSSQGPRYPLVFISGIDGSAIFDWNARIVTAVPAFDGTRAYHVQVLPWSPTADRAQDLWASLQTLSEQTGSGKLNLICYAVGGLDCRYVASPAGLFRGDASGYAAVANTIASITTIATPHRGTRVADAALAALQSGTIDDVVQTLVGSSVSVDIPNDAQLTETLQGLTLDALATFDQNITDGPGIVYQSWAGVSQILAQTSPASEQAIRQHCVDGSGNFVFFRHENTRDAMNEVLWVTAPFSGTSLDAQRAGHYESVGWDGLRRERQVGRVPGLHSRRPLRRHRRDWPHHARPADRFRRAAVLRVHRHRPGREGTLRWASSVEQGALERRSIFGTSC